jgi:hypothetical protein
LINGSNFDYLIADNYMRERGFLMVIDRPLCRDWAVFLQQKTCRYQYEDVEGMVANCKDYTHGGNYTIEMLLLMQRG